MASDQNLTHEPLEVRSYEDGWLTVVKCSCDDEVMPTTSRWLTDHFQGSQSDGVARLREVVAKQRAEGFPTPHHDENVRSVDHAREARYAEAIMGGKERADLLAVRNPGEVVNAHRDARAVVAVADSEREQDAATIAELRAEVERLRGGIRALADEWDREDAAYWEFIHQPNVERAIDAAKYSIVTDLRALLSPSPAATTGEACVHVWEAEYLPDPMSAGSVISSGDDFCTECGVTKDATRAALAPATSPAEQGGAS